MVVTSGLDGVVAVTSEISSIVDGVLAYRGYNIDDLAHSSTFEEVAFLLWEGVLPTRDQLNQLKKDFDDYASIPDKVIDQMRQYPKDGSPMAVLRSMLSTLGLYDEEAEVKTAEAHRLKAVKLTAQLPTIITAYDRLRRGLEPVPPKSGLGIAGNFLYMLSGEEPNETATCALDKALILHADHELNASTFAARVTTGTLSDMYSAVVSAVGTLKGPLHGGANEQVMVMLEQIGTLDRVEPVVREKLVNKEKIMGFGHRVYKDGDPRAKHLRQMSFELGQQSDSTWYDLSVMIEQLVYEEKRLQPNVDFYSASVYRYLGIPKDLFTPIFAVSRMTGWTAHIMEQYANNRLIRPRAEYTGLQNQVYISIDQRL